MSLEFLKKVVYVAIDPSRKDLMTCKLLSIFPLYSVFVQITFPFIFLTVQSFGKTWKDASVYDSKTFQ